METPGNIPLVDHLLTVAELRKLGVLNTDPALPVSPCVKAKPNGRIFPWDPVFAKRPEVFVNCDEFGNTDPAAWQGRGPTGWEPDPAPPEKFDVPQPMKVVYAPDAVLDGSAMAKAVDGLADYADPSFESDVEDDGSFLPPPPIVR